MQIYKVGECGFDDCDLSYMDQEQYEWLVYEYAQGHYDGDGQAVALRKDGQLQVKNLGHCSCYGPMDEWLGASVVTVDEFFRVKENIHDDDWSDLVKSKVRELLGL